MPEGDTVWRACKRLNQALGGQELLRTDFRVPSLATTDLSGRTMLEVVARGKHLLMRVSGGVTVHSHFRMDGSWHLYRPGERWHGGPDHQIRAVLETALLDGRRLPAAGARPRRDGRRGHRRRSPRAGSAVAVVRPRRRDRQRRGRSGANHQRGVARPAESRRHRQLLSHRGLLPARPPPVAPGRPRSTYPRRSTSAGD